jgi:hypothetical protein
VLIGLVLGQSSNPNLLRWLLAPDQTNSSRNKAAELCSWYVLFLEMKRQAVCKPGSVPIATEVMTVDDHSSGTSVAGRLTRPTRAAARKCAICSPYSVLLPVGFALPPPLPGVRCALTAPLPVITEARRAVCFLWHFPWGCPRRPLTGTVLPWSPDFPHTNGFPHCPRAVIRPPGERDA